jgi:hypothetical protein
MKGKNVVYLVVFLSLVVGGYFLWGGEYFLKSNNNKDFRKMEYEVEIDDIGTIKSPTSDFYKNVFGKTLNEKKLRKIRTKITKSKRSIQTKLEKKLKEKKPDLNRRFISYQAANKLNERLKQSPEYWVSQGLFSMKLWKEKKKYLGNQKCSIANMIFASDHVLTSLNKTKEENPARRIRQFIVENYESLLKSCENFGSYKFYSTMVLEEPSESTLPRNILSSISKKVVSIAKTSLEQLKKNQRELQEGKIEEQDISPRYNSEVVKKRMELLRENIDLFSRYVD